MPQKCFLSPLAPDQWCESTAVKGSTLYPLSARQERKHLLCPNSSKKISKEEALFPLVSCHDFLIGLLFTLAIAPLTRQLKL